jgi:SMI1/KNR4 family protein SUKH-1
MNDGLDYKKLCHKIVSLWQDDNVPLNAGATEQELSEFEMRFGLTLPPDFRYFYSQVNGMPDLESDARLFSLWPLSRMIQEADGIVFDRTVTPPRIEIAFGDFLIDCEPSVGRFGELQNVKLDHQRLTTEDLAQRKIACGASSVIKVK